MHIHDPASPQITGVIPARYHSTRFPGKPLVDILGTSMILRVVRQAQQSRLLTKVVVATDDQRIYDHVAEAGCPVMMTDRRHLSGTDRLGEVASSEAGEYFVNIQGDEPLIDPVQIDQVAEMCLSGAEISTLAYWQTDPERIESPNSVKVVMNEDGEALYFSRAVIPYQAIQRAGGGWQHIGIYGFSRPALAAITCLPPHSLEQNEQLEQLRWLAHGYRIRVGKSEQPAHGVDSPEDLEAIIRRLR